MELDLSRTSVDHRSRPNRHNSGGRVKSSRMRQTSLQNLLMLLNPDIQRHIIALGPSSQRTQPQDRILVTLGLQILTSGLHQVGMPSVCGVSRLEGIHGIRTLGLELVHKLRGSLTPLIESIIVTNAIEQFNFTTNQPVATRVNILNVRMTIINDTKHTRDNLLLAVAVDFRIAKNGNRLSHLSHQSDGVHTGIFNRLLGKTSAGKSDRDAHADTLRRLLLGKVAKVRLFLVDHGVSSQIIRIDEDGVEMKRLQQSTFSHETGQRSSPAFTNHLKPVQINIGNAHLGQSLSLRTALLTQMSRNVTIDPQISIGIWQRRRKLRGALQDTIPLKTREQLIGRLFNGHLVCLKGNFRIQRLFIRIINTGKVLELTALHTRVLTLGIALLQLIHRNIQKHLVKRNALILVTFAHSITIGTVWTDQTNERNGTTIRKQRGNLTGTTHAFLTIRLTET
mmetsp:Transcript_12774/g.19307  ORF Transcript_12774/g.19307 Transcript_12774/m.19307 type:complete len:452 (+) Transcript_12774:1276-2631(+)